MWREPDGLYYVRARNYDPRTGRFLSRDPAEGRRSNPTTFASYAFAHNNSFLFRDPTGELSLSQTSITATVSSILATVARPTILAVAAACTASFAAREVEVAIGADPAPDSNPCTIDADLFYQVLTADDAAAARGLHDAGRIEIPVLVLPSNELDAVDGNRIFSVHGPIEGPLWLRYREVRSRPGAFGDISPKVTQVRVPVGVPIPQIRVLEGFR